MKIWFIRHKNESLGPYTIEELKNLAVTKDDYVWKEGFKNWMQVKSVPELNPLVTNAAPPAFKAQRNSNSNSSYNKKPTTHYSDNSSGTQQNKMRRRLIWISILLVLSLATYLVYANNHSAYVSPFSHEKLTEQLRVELAQSERNNPTKYLSGQVRNHPNLIGQTVVEGTLTNFAKIVVFKDVVMQVDYLSKTKSIITTQNFTVYQTIAPGQTITFKNKTFISKDVVDAHVTIMNALPAE